MDQTDDEVQKIVDTWKRVMGMNLNPQNVKEHLKKIKAWQEHGEKLEPGTE
jgi:hypothetical protein